MGDVVEALVSLVARVQRFGRHPDVRPAVRGFASVPSDHSMSNVLAQAGSFVQPDSTTCGSSVLVLARLLTDPAYAAEFLGGDPAEVRTRFAREALAMHRRTNRCWPRFWGTTPRAVARQLGRSGVRYRTRYVDAKDRGSLFDAIVRAVGDGYLVPIYTYDVRGRHSGAHVTLALGLAGDDLRVYDPGRGAVVTVGRTEFRDARLAGTLGWDRPGAAVLPEGSKERTSSPVGVPGGKE